MEEPEFWRNEKSDKTLNGEMEMTWPKEKKRFQDPGMNYNGDGWISASKKNASYFSYMIRGLAYRYLQMAKEWKYI